MSDTQNKQSWPTTVGAACIVVAGLSVFGGCLSLTGMTELEQLHTAIPFGGGEISEDLLSQLADIGPPAWLALLISMTTILFSITLAIAGMGLLQHAPNARATLRYWSVLYLLFTLAKTCMQWLPRLELVQENHEVKGLFLAQLVISLPMYLVLPVFLLVYLGKTHVCDDVARWR